MRRTLPIALLALLWAHLGTQAARAEEVRLGVETSIEYDRNLFNSEVDKVDDWAIRVKPLLGLRETEGLFTYEVRYEPRWETFVNGSVDDDWDQNAFGRARWQVSPRTTLEASERFLLTRSQSRAGFIADPGAPDLGPTPAIEVARQQITRNILSFSGSHVFSPRWTGEASVDYSLFRTDRENRVDSDVVSTTGSMNYQLRPNDLVGGGVGYTWQGFSATDMFPESQTNIVRVFASWFHSFSPTFTLSVQGGPTWILSDRSADPILAASVPALPFRDTATGGVRTIDSTTCPTADDGQPILTDDCGLLPSELTGPAAQVVRSTSTTIMQIDSQQSASDLVPTFFGGFNLSKSWDEVRAIASYQRRDSTASGVGTATVLDFVNGTVIWEPDNHWQLFVGVGWTKRTSSTSTLVNGIGLGPPGVFPFVVGSTLIGIAGSPSTDLRLVDADNLVDVQTLQGQINLTRRIGRHSNAFVRVLYLKQKSTGAIQREFSDFRVSFGVRMRLDWIRL